VARRLTCVGVGALMLVGVWVGTRTTSAAPGEPLASFGDDGVVRIPAPVTTVVPVVDQLLLQDDDKTLGLVNQHAFTGEEFIVRWTADGQVDPSWNGGVPLPVQSSFNAPGRMALAADGSVFYAIGSRIMKFTATGAPDDSFGSEGIAMMHLPNTSFDVIDLVALDGGGVAVGGLAGTTSWTRAFVARLLPSGAPDPLFGEGGATIFGLQSGFRPTFHRVVGAPDGSVWVHLSNMNTHALIALTPAGSLRGEFGNAGELTLTSTRPCLLVDTSGGPLIIEELAVAVPSAHLEVRRLMATTGALDPAYGTSGVASIALPVGADGFTCASGVAQSGDSVFVAHRARAGDVWSEYITAFDLSQGLTVAGFGTGGSDGDGTVKLDSAISQDTVVPRKVAASSGGVVVQHDHLIGGLSSSWLTRLDTTGTTVAAFDGDGTLPVSLAHQLAGEAHGMVREADGGLLVVSMVSLVRPIALQVARLSPAGTSVAPATQLVIIDIRHPDPRGEVTPVGIASLPDGRIAVAYQTRIPALSEPRQMHLEVFEQDGTFQFAFDADSLPSVVADIRSGGTAAAPTLLVYSRAIHPDPVRYSFTRLDVNGRAADASFGVGGTVSFATSLGDRPQDYRESPDGGLYWAVAGEQSQGSHPEAFAVVTKLTPSGAVDVGFGSGGQRVIIGPNGENAGVGLRVDVVGASVVVTGVGHSPSPIAHPVRAVAAKLTSSGALDVSFGVNGVRSVPSVRGPVCSYADSSGIVFLTYESWLPSDLAVLRFTADGQVDERVGPGGRVMLRIPIVNGFTFYDIVAVGDDVVFTFPALSMPAVGQLAEPVVALARVSLWGVDEIGTAARATRTAVRLGLTPASG